MLIQTEIIESCTVRNHRQLTLSLRVFTSMAHLTGADISLETGRCLRCGINHLLSHNIVWLSPSTMSSAASHAFRSTTASATSSAMSHAFISTTAPVFSFTTASNPGYGRTCFAQTATEYINVPASSGTKKIFQNLSPIQLGRKKVQASSANAGETKNQHQLQIHFFVNHRQKNIRR